MVYPYHDNILTTVTFLCVNLFPCRTTARAYYNFQVEANCTNYQYWHIRGQSQAFTHAYISKKQHANDCPGNETTALGCSELRS